MKFSLPAAHRLARINYAPRVASFALTFLVLGALFAERGYTAWELALAALSFLVYPHLAYLHARLALKSKQAEFNNLYADSIVMGVWVVQIDFALWPSVMLLSAIILNNAANGGIRRLLWGSLCFAAAAAVWAAGTGYGFHPDTGTAVTALSVLGIVIYVSWVGTILFVQNKVLIRMSHHLQDFERQFRFVAESSGEMVSMLDKQGRFLYASSLHARHFDSSVVDSGSSWLDLVHPDDQERARAFLGRLASTQKRQSAQLRMVPSKGAARVVECHGSPATDPRGTMSGIVMVMQQPGGNVVRLARN